MKIRDALDSDAEKIAQLATELGYPSEKNSIRERIAAIRERDDQLLVATDDADEAQGFIQANRIWIIEAGFRVEIMGLVVAARARRSGIGRELIAAVERWAKSIGAEAVVVRSNTQRSESHRFYPALGYETVKTQAVYEKKI